jgi:hypothetical protein
MGSGYLERVDATPDVGRKGKDGCDLATIGARVTKRRKDIHREVLMDRGGGQESQGR